MSGILVNDSMYDFTSIEFRANNVYFPGIKEISYSDEYGQTLVYGTLPQPVGRTRGVQKPEGSVTFYRSSFDELLDTLGDGFAEVTFEIVVMYGMDGQPLIIDTLQGARIQKPETSPSQGSDPIEVKVGLSLMGLLWNGKKPFRGMIAI